MIDAAKTLLAWAHWLAEKSFPSYTVRYGAKLMSVQFLTTPIGSSWEKVRAALANPNFDFRTIDGISGETGLSPDEVKQLLDEHTNEVRISLATDSQGRLLYTLRNRSPKLEEVLFNIKTIVSSTSSAT